MKRKPTNMSANEKNPMHLGLLELISFGVVNMGGTFTALTGSFLMLFYTDIVGLSAVSVATLFLVARIVDGISDPVTGFLLDRAPVTKFGKFRPIIVIGTIATAINLVLVFFGPYWVPVGKLTIAYITYLLIGVISDIQSIPLNGLLPRITDDEKSRNGLSTAKALAASAGALVLSISAPLIVADMQINSFYTLVFGTSIIGVVLTVVGIAGVKERMSMKMANAGTKKEEHYSFLEMLKMLLYKPVIIFIIMFLSMAMCNSIGSGVGAYYYTYVMGNLKIMSTMSVVMLFGQIPAYILAVPISNRFGKKNAFQFGSVVYIIGTLLRLIDTSSISVAIAASFISIFGHGLLSPIVYSMLADNMDYVEYRSGKRADSAVAASNSFVMKCAQGVGGSIPLYIMGAAGYVQGMTTMTTAVTNSIIFSFVILPSLLTLFMIILMGFGYKLNEGKINKINAELATRHEVQTSAE